jgi:hypothetical protein
MLSSICWADLEIPAVNGEVLSEVQTVKIEAQLDCWYNLLRPRGVLLRTV